MKEDLYISLLQKELSGGLAPEERASLDSWLAGSPEHRRIAQSVRKAWELSGGFKQDVELDMEADFEKIRHRIARVEKAPARVVPLRRRWALRVAAAVVLLLVAPFVVKKFLRPGVPSEVAFAGDQPRSEAVALVDGSRVYLNANSRLTYFAAAGGKERRVKLEGEAFFDVARDESKPFVVETPSGEVTVLGTSFSVQERPDGTSIEVEVASGKVKLQPKGGGSHLILVKNEKGIFYKQENKLEKTVDPGLNDLAWHTRRLSFQNTSLKDALAAINRLYQVEVKTNNPATENCPLTVTFDQKNLDTVLATLQALLGAQLERQVDGSYLLTGGRCE
ncbi:MAG: FecR domain-containing protein [Saprospiraceae bacterium]